MEVHTPVVTNLPWKDVFSAEAHILLYVQAHPDKTQWDVATALSLTPNWVSRALRRLEKLGLVVARRGLAEDRRRVRYTACEDALLGDDTLGVMTVGQFVRAMSVAGAWLMDVPRR